MNNASSFLLHIHIQQIVIRITLRVNAPRLGIDAVFEFVEVGLVFGGDEDATPSPPRPAPQKPSGP
ncbi:MAG: hypothetical protein J6U21_00645 [Bacteroidales bacterium]|nr:hypothetical protein [Bacteroidales bacterium]